MRNESRQRLRALERRDMAMAVLAQTRALEPSLKGCLYRVIVEPGGRNDARSYKPSCTVLGHAPNLVDQEVKLGVEVAGVGR